MASPLNDTLDFAQRLDDFVAYWLSEGIPMANMILELDLARQTLVLDELVRRNEEEDGPAGTT